MPSPPSLDCRSLLFVPADRPDRVVKAFATPARLVCLDLEDAIAPDRKAAARASLLGGSRAHLGDARAVVRINNLRAAEGLADLLALREIVERPLVMIPKVADAEHLRIAAGVAGEDWRWIAQIETAEGLENVREIARSEGVVALILGCVDLAVELGAENQAWEPMLWARSRVVHAAALAGGVPVIDSPKIYDLDDEASHREECRRSRALGLSGKSAIHPKQLPVIHEVFTPDAEEIRRARAIVSVYEAQRGGVALLEGRLVERPTYEAARRVLERTGQADGIP